MRRATILDLEDFILNVLGWILISAVMVGFVGLPWWIRAYNLWSSPCTEVYDGSTLIYRGNSFFYETESRGTGTIFKQYNESVLFIRQIKEIQSDKISIKTVSCDSINNNVK